MQTTNTTKTFRCTKCGQTLIHTELNSSRFSDAYVCPKCGHKERLATKLRKQLLWGTGGLYAIGIVIGSFRRKR